MTDRLRARRPTGAGLWFVVALMGGCTSPPRATIPYQQNFDSGALSDEWSSTGGGWSVKGGRLFNDGARNVPLWLSASLPADVTVTFNAESRSPAVDLKCEIFGNGRDHQSGYVIILSGWDNSKSIIARLDEHGPERTPARTEALRGEVAADAATARDRYSRAREVVARRHRSEPNRSYHFRIERRGNTLSFFVDDQLHLSYFDPSPLSGRGHDRFALGNWASEVYFDDLVIEPLSSLH